MANALSIEESFVQKLNDILEANLENEQFGVEELVEAMGMSRSQLHRKLHAVTGKSTSQFIREFRLEKAMDMLQNNVATASEIAYQVGFHSPTYFNTSFREFYGYPPGEVKFRNASYHKEDVGIQTSKDETSTTVPQKKRYYQRSFLIVPLMILLTATLFYYLYSNANTTTAATTEIKEVADINDISIAVLPIKNWSGDPELQYLCHGMTDAVISRLDKIKSITKVVPFSSVTKYNDTDKSVVEIAKEQGVTNILQGSFQISGNQLKVTLQLINGLTNSQYWSAEYSGQWNSDEIFNVQAEVAENVAKELNAEITEGEFKAIAKMPTKNIEAYNVFLQAEYKHSKLNLTDCNEAIALYERAIALDPDFTDAYISYGKFWLYGGLIWGVFDEQQAWTKSKVLLERAFELEPTNYKAAHVLNTGYFYYDWNFMAMENYLRAVNETENYVEPQYVRYTDYSQKMGDFDKNFLWHESQIRKFPLDPWNYILNAWSLVLMDEKAKAHKFITSSEPLFTNDLNFLMESSRLYYYLGDYKSATKQFDVIMNKYQDRFPLILWLNSVLANVNGTPSQNYLNQLYQLYNSKASGSPAWFIALYYAHIKDYDKTFEWLQKSYDRHEVEMTRLKVEPLLRQLQTDPRYIKLYKKVGFPKFE